MILSATFSKPAKNCETALGKPYIRIKIRYMNTNDGPAWFAEIFTKKQVFHKKFNKKEVELFWEKNAGKTFYNCFARTEDKEISILANKKGHITKLEKKLSATQKPENISCSCSIDKDVSKAGFNRTKNYILPEGLPVPFLIHLGIMNDNGKIIAAKYDKFRQINRFLEFIDDVLPAVIKLIYKEENVSPQEDLPRPVRIVDFGCGKSYLTFAVHYWLTHIKKLPVEITGLDLKEDVINYCNELAKDFNCKNLTFAIGNIADYNHKNNPDIVITLHACDTATDYALNYAVKHSTKAILSVPCCQHELNTQIGNWKKEHKSKKNKDLDQSPFEVLLHYGIIQERFAALATDALRAEYLEKAGYHVQILEFIDMSHTPKNLLIRAVAKNTVKPNSSIKKDQTNRFTQALHVSPTLQQLLSN